MYVTHDQVEAMTLADRIAVMRGGKIEQIGTPSELYDHPANLFVAGFIGSPQMNCLAGEVTQSGALKLASGETIALPAGAAALAGRKVTAGIRPEHWHMTGDDGGIALTAEFIERLGSSVNIHLRQPGPDGAAIIWHHVEPARVSDGESVRLMPDPDHIHVFDQDGRAIALSR